VYSQTWPQWLFMLAISVIKVKWVVILMVLTAKSPSWLLGNLVLKVKLAHILAILQANFDCISDQIQSLVCSNTVFHGTTTGHSKARGL